MNFLPSLTQDKANHFIYGHLLACVAVGVAIASGNAKAAWILALLVPIAFGGFKEALDAYGNRKATGATQEGPHGVEWWDFLATAAGGVPLVIILFVLQ